MRNLKNWLYIVIFSLVPSIGASQDLSISLSESGAFSSQAIELLGLVTILSIAPGILITVTCFPFLVTVFSILRQAIGLQQSPPNMLIVSLALFLTFFIMEPVMTEAWSEGISPFRSGVLGGEEAFLKSIEPFKVFMVSRVDFDTLVSLSELSSKEVDLSSVDESPLSVIVPSFLLSEIARAFQVGFLIFLPFLVIDLVAAAVLMSMGMMMVPPAIVSLPFKLGFFVIADGWTLLATGLVKSYG